MLSGGRWTKIYALARTFYPYKRMRWYAGKVRVAADFKLSRVIDGKLGDSMHDGEKIGAYPYIDTADGFLILAASKVRVTLFDADNFHHLVKPYK